MAKKKKDKSCKVLSKTQCDDKFTCKWDEDEKRCVPNWFPLALFLGGMAGAMALLPGAKAQPQGPIEGCMDKDARNYNPKATIQTTTKCIFTAQSCKKNGKFYYKGRCIFPDAKDPAFPGPCKPNEILKDSVTLCPDGKKLSEWLQCGQDGGDYWYMNQLCPGESKCKAGNIEVISWCKDGKTPSEFYVCNGDGTAKTYIYSPCPCDPQNLINCPNPDDCKKQGGFYYGDVCNPKPFCKPDSILNISPIELCADGSIKKNAIVSCNKEGTGIVEEIEDIGCCEALTPELCGNKGDCLKNGGFWYDDKCNKNPKPPECDQAHPDLCTDPNDCAMQGMYWYQDKCHKDQLCKPDETICFLGNAFLCNNVGTGLIDKGPAKLCCDIMGWYFYDGKCNKTPKKICNPKDLKQGSEVYCPKSPTVLSEWEECSADGYKWENKSQKCPDVCDAQHLDLCTDPNSCKNFGGFWYNDKCNLNPLCNAGDVLCVNGVGYQCLPNQSEYNLLGETKDCCDKINGYWYGGKCNQNPLCKTGEHKPGSDIKCLTDGSKLSSWEICNATHTGWDKKTGTCPKCDAQNLDLCTDPNDCKNFGGFWYNGKCNLNPFCSKGEIKDNKITKTPCWNGVDNAKDEWEECNTDLTGWESKSKSFSCPPQPQCDKNNLDLCNDPTNCEKNGGYWYNGKCNKQPICTPNAFISSKTTSTCPADPKQAKTADVTYCNNKGTNIIVKKETYDCKECDKNNLDLCDNYPDCNKAGGWYYNWKCNPSPACNKGQQKKDSYKKTKCADGSLETEKWEECNFQQTGWLPMEKIHKKCSDPPKCDINNPHLCLNPTDCKNKGYWYNGKCNKFAFCSVGEVKLNSKVDTLCWDKKTISKSTWEGCNADQTGWTSKVQTFNCPGQAEVLVSLKVINTEWVSAQCPIATKNIYMEAFITGLNGDKVDISIDGGPVVTKNLLGAKTYKYNWIYCRVAGKYDYTINIKATDSTSKKSGTDSIKATIKKECHIDVNNCPNQNDCEKAGGYWYDGKCNKNKDSSLGCTNKTATNYNPKATKDDGSCYWDFKVCKMDNTADCKQISKSPIPWDFYKHGPTCSPKVCECNDCLEKNDPKTYIEPYSNVNIGEDLNLVLVANNNCNKNATTITHAIITVSLISPNKGFVPKNPDSGVLYPDNVKFNPFAVVPISLKPGLNKINLPPMKKVSNDETIINVALGYTLLKGYATCLSVADVILKGPGPADKCNLSGYSHYRFVDQNGKSMNGLKVEIKYVSGVCSSGVTENIGAVALPNTKETSAKMYVNGIEIPWLYNTLQNKYAFNNNKMVIMLTPQFFSGKCDSSKNEAKILYFLNSKNHDVKGQKNSTQLVVERTGNKNPSSIQGKISHLNEFGNPLSTGGYKVKLTQTCNYVQSVSMQNPNTYFKDNNMSNKNITLTAEYALKSNPGLNDFVITDTIVINGDIMKHNF